jgi:hypothetical protein
VDIDYLHRLLHPKKRKKYKKGSTSLRIHTLHLHLQDYASFAFVSPGGPQDEAQGIVLLLKSFTPGGSHEETQEPVFVIKF